MAYFINDGCIGCGACVTECPAATISEKDGKFVIDASACIDCRNCVDACPADAIEHQQ